MSDGEEEEEEKDSNERKITVLQREGDEQGKPFLLTWLKNKRCVIEKGGSEKRKKKLRGDNERVRNGKNV